MFNSMGQPVGAQITNYLLEKVSHKTRNCFKTRQEIDGIRTESLVRSVMREISTSSISSQREQAPSKRVRANIYNPLP